MTGAIEFDGNSLQTDNIITNVINHTNLPEKIVALYLVANADKSVNPNTEYPSKVITISGVIKADDTVFSFAGGRSALLDSRIDSFKGYFNGRNKELDIEYAGTTRRYLATVNSISVERQGALLFAPFSVEFICAEPFGREVTATELINELNYTSATLTEAINIEGTAPFQLPIVTITIDSLTGTGDYVQLSNDGNGQDMVILGYSLTAGDVLVIDCEARLVTLNGDVIDYYGSFLELEPGAQSITYTDGFTTRTVDILVEYYKRYL